MALLTDAEITRELVALPGWTRVGEALERQFVFSGFPGAVAFVQRLVPGSEAAGHHPDISIHYRRVTVAFTTHDEGGLTARDVDGARMANRQAEPGA